MTSDMLFTLVLIVIVIGIPVAAEAPPQHHRPPVT